MTNFRQSTVDSGSRSDHLAILSFNKKNAIKKLPKNYYESLGNNYDFDKKVLQCAWHPKNNILAIACLNCLFFYNSGL